MEAQLDWLKRKGWTFFTVGELWAQWDELPEKSVAITFDDGYADNHDVAMPLLLRHGLSATFFIATGFVDGEPFDACPRQVLRRQLARGLAPLPELSWSRPSRSYLANQGRRGSHRLPFEPGTGATRRVPRLAVIVDVSGSIDDALLQRFCREIEAIARRTGAGARLVTVEKLDMVFSSMSPLTSRLLGRLDGHNGG